MALEYFRVSFVPPAWIIMICWQRVLLGCRPAACDCLCPVPAPGSPLVPLEAVQTVVPALRLPARRGPGYGPALPKEIGFVGSPLRSGRSVHVPGRCIAFLVPLVPHVQGRTDITSVLPCVQLLGGVFAGVACVRRGVGCPGYCSLREVSASWPVSWSGPVERFAARRRFTAEGSRPSFLSSSALHPSRVAWT